MGQDEVDRRTRELGARVSQSYLSQIERGTRSLEDMGAARMEVLRRVYKIDPEDWVNHTGLAIVVKSSDEVSDSTTHYFPAEELQVDPVTLEVLLPLQLSDTLQAFIDKYAQTFKELLEPRWQRWLANTDFRDEPETPEDWLSVFMYFREKVNPR